MMRVLVTGGSGAIGSFVVEELVNRGDEVTVFDIDPPTQNKVSFVKGDITDLESVLDAVSGVDAVIHLAAILPPACEQDPHRAEKINVGGTLNILDAIQGTGKRVVCLSSKGALGSMTGQYAHPTYEPVGESHYKNPVNVYGTTKMAVEQYCQAYSANKNVDVSVVRLSSTWGPGKGPRHGELDLISRLIEGAARGKRIHVTGGDQRNDLVYYADIAQGLVRLVGAVRLPHLVYHIGSGRVVKLSDFGVALADLFPDSLLTIEGGLNYFEQIQPTYCLLDISRARQDIGYEPKFDVEAGVKDYLLRMGIDT
jgi:UDP-glucose 4-epimerase